MLIDAHAHFFSRPFYEFHAAAAGLELEAVAAATRAQIPEPDPLPLAERWLAEMDRQGLERLVLIASIPGDEGSVAAAVARGAGRISGYFMLNPNASDALARIKQGLGAQGLKGVCLFPALHHFDPGEERFFPLYEEIRRCSGVAFVHFGLLKVPIREKLGLRPLADLRFSNPVLLNRAANAFPDLPFVIPHFGGGFLHETLLLGSQTRNVYVDTSSSNGWMKLLPGLDLRKVFELALGAFGPGRILFGTDSSGFPRGWRRDLYEEQCQVLAALGLPEAEQKQILGLNAARLLDAPAKA